MKQAIRSVRLDPALTRPVGQYSQGMRQRMSLARAILHDPKILLLDEPFSNVDVHSAQEMVALLKAMRDEGKTIFVVTHQASLLEGVADEFVWMEYGKIVERTSESEAAGSERNEFAALHHAGDADERYPAGVALARCDQLHVVFFAAGGGDLQLFFRSECGRVARDCGWADLGRVSVCRGGGFEPDLGARVAQPGAGCLPGFSGSGELVICR